MKHEWRKSEKVFYLPKAKPEVVEVPAFQFLTLKGQGNPNTAAFTECIQALYSVSYAMKMTLKKQAETPKGYQDYTVYPLEGVWDITDEAKKQFTGTINKDDLVFKLMIRQPDFISPAFFEEMLARTKIKTPNPNLDLLKLETIKEGICIQMLHVGSFDDEPATFAKMEAFAENEGWVRKSKLHREIYLSDFRKVPTEKLKTVLRFQLNN